MIDELGDFMVGEACQLARDLREPRHATSRSRSTCRRSSWRSPHSSSTSSSSSPIAAAPGALTLEITESRFIANRPRSPTTRAPSRRGYRCSIDDFGVGHSSVEQVLALPANELKIDRTIVQDADATNGALLATIVRLVRDRGLRTVAEGVETEATARARSRARLRSRAGLPDRRADAAAGARQALLDAARASPNWSTSRS